MFVINDQCKLASAMFLNHFVTGTQLKSYSISPPTEKGVMGLSVVGHNPWVGEGQLPR
jgi:hypothetical protein